jgi:glutamyl-tRNA reductase
VISHRRAALDVLERMPRGSDLPPALADLSVAGGAVGLSTCNRFEVYLEDDAATPPVTLLDRLSERTGVERAALAGCTDVLRGEAAVRHLFAVAAGLESRLVGEDEILGQVRSAAREAALAGTVTPGLAELFEWAVRAGRRARRAAGLTEGRISLATRAVDVLDRAQPLRGRTVLVLGSGHMAGRVLAALLDTGARVVLLARRPESVEAPGVTVLALGELPRVIDDADAVLCATSAPIPVLGAELLERAGRRRRGRPPLAVVDLAVPRNVQAPPYADGVLVLGLDALTDDDARPDFAAAVSRARDVVDGEVRAYCDRGNRSTAGPLIARVLAHAESIRRAEVARAARLDGAADAGLLDELAARLVQKILHAPITAIREQAGAGNDDLAQLLAAALGGDDPR